MPLVTLLAKQEGLTSVDVHYARGIGRITPKHLPSRTDSREKEVVTVMVPCDLADEFFQLIYRVAGIGEPHGGLMYMHGLQAAIPQLLPELSEEQ